LNCGFAWLGKSESSLLDCTSGIADTLIDYFYNCFWSRFFSSKALTSPSSFSSSEASFGYSAYRQA
jgi:hypothetical protein